MKRCITCEGLLPDSNFPANGPMCKACITRLQKVFHVDYAPPERKTIKEAYVSLIEAIREQAIKDDAVSEWRDYWVHSSTWSRVWGMLQYTQEQSEVISESTNTTIGGLL